LKVAERKKKAGEQAAHTFEEGLAGLEALVARLEGEMPLEEAMAVYEEGVKLHTLLAAQLDQAEKKLKTLSREGDEP